MSKVVGFPLKRDEGTSLQRLLDMGVIDHVEGLSGVSETASKEWSIEKALEKMEGDWQTMTFLLHAYKDTGTYILEGANVDEVQTLLDDHLVKTATMKSSPYAGSFSVRIQTWENQLNHLLALTDEWLKVQATWQYVEESCVTQHHVTPGIHPVYTCIAVYTPVYTHYTPCIHPNTPLNTPYTPLYTPYIRSTYALTHL